MLNSFILVINIIGIIHHISWYESACVQSHLGCMLWNLPSVLAEHLWGNPSDECPVKVENRP